MKYNNAVTATIIVSLVAVVMLLKYSKFSLNEQSFLFVFFNLLHCCLFVSLRLFSLSYCHSWSIR